MWKSKLCLGIGNFGVSFEEQPRLFKKVGFDGFFIEWSSDRDKQIDGLKKLGDEPGLIFQSIHAPYTNMNKMWENGDASKEAADELIEFLNACKRNNVPIMVCHSFIGFEEHNPTRQGAENFSRVVDEAEKLDIKIAFENTEGEEYLAYLMDFFRDRECVGFCWDTGHEMCYNYSDDMMAMYGDRILCTHINDNLGIKDYDGKITWIDDLHFLPFDGVADWDDIALRLNKYGFTDTLTFELITVSKPERTENDVYGRMEIHDYLTEAYKRACRVAYKVNNKKISE